MADTSALAPDWDAARALYPGADETVYLDSAALGLISTRVHDAMTAVLDGHLMAGGAAVAGWREDAFEVRTAVAELSSSVMPGVVCLPHGWGHGVDGAQLRVAKHNPGVNLNLVTDDAVLDDVSGCAAFNGVVVRVAPA